MSLSIPVYTNQANLCKSVQPTVVRIPTNVGPLHSKQAYDAIKKKYANGAPPAVSTPKSNGKTKSTPKKRASVSEDGDGEATSSKRAKKEASFSKDAEDELAS